ncbi:MAG: ABC transporter permease subunit [Clostridia bacterium]|nr:ABC transporter permease subunit [Clostridia bacterium]
MTAVFLREVGAYFKGVLGYLFAAFLLIFAGIYTMAYNLSGAYANFEYVLDAVSFIYLIAVPILSMRTLAEEKRQRTDQLLYALPVPLYSVVIGKYLAMLVVLAVPMLVMSLYPLILSQFGAVPMALAYGSLLGFFLLGACLLSIGLFISSITESQVAAAVITLVVMLLLYFMSALAGFVSTDAFASLIALAIFALLFALVLYALAKNPIVSAATALVLVGGLYVGYLSDSAAFAGLFGDIMTKLSVFDRFYTFVNGVFDWTAVVYDVSIAAVFLFLTVQAMEKRRWSE